MYVEVLESDEILELVSSPSCLGLELRLGRRLDYNTRMITKRIFLIALIAAIIFYLALIAF